MPALESQINTASELYAGNQAAYQKELKRLNDAIQWAIDGGVGRDKVIARHLDRGKVMVRDRIDMLIDDGTPFLELSTLATWGQYDNTYASAAMVTGIGLVHGIPCMIIANDATIKGGSWAPESVKKHVRAQQIAEENSLPTIYLVDSGGAFLPMQDQVFPDKDHFGNTFYRQSRMSAMGLPQISVVLGGCTAGGAYIPALSDEVIMVKGIGRIFLGGPPIVKAALNEIVDPETLGGADVHTRVSGVSDYIAYDEAEAYGHVREIVANLNQPRVDQLNHWFDVAEPRPPKYAAEEIYGIINQDDRLPFDVRDIIARLVDASEFWEFKPLWGQSIVCGYARIWGFKVGIIGNNGIIFSEDALKATQFIETCNQRRIPLLFLQNTTGYMVGKDAEAGGIAKDGAKMVNAVANSTVPKYTVLIGGSYGAGNYGMCGRGFHPRFLFAWPNSRIATMAAATAETVLVDIRKAGMKGSQTSDAELEAIRLEIRGQYETQSDPYYATSRLWDDGLIDPAHTRDILGLCIALAGRQPEPEARYRVFRM